MNKNFMAIVWLAILCAAGCSDSRRPIVVSLTPSTAQTMDQGQSLTINAVLTNDKDSKGVTWASTGSGSLSSQTSSSVVYNAPGSGVIAEAKIKLNAKTAVTENQTATVTATSVADTKGTASVSITVMPPPALSTNPFPDATEGTAYSQSVTANGGAGTLTYALASGTLPAGLSLNGSTGAITGTPTAAGTSTFTIKVTDSSNAGPLSATSGSLTIKVNLTTAPSITTASLPGGTVGTAYNQTVSATVGLSPLTFTISAGALPGGLSIGATSGAITGTPTTAGTYTFTVKATDSSMPTAQTATKQLSIVVATTFAITTSSLPNGTVSTAYSQQLQAAGGTTPVTWSLQTGSSLPAGLAISGAGLISGTPTATGTTNFTVKAVDSSATPQTITKALSITIAANTAGLCDPTNTGSESLLNGQYAMVVQGFNSVGTSLVGATFDADGAGHIATHVGVIDVNRNNGAPAGPYNSPIDSTQSSYTIGADHRGCLNIVSSAGTFPFRFSVSSIVSGVATKAHVIEIISLFESGSGTLLKQDPSAFHTSQLQGNYAFGIGAEQSNHQKYAAVGLFHLDGAGAVTGQLDTNLAGDLNSNGATFPAAAITIASGTYSVAANGRGSLGFTPTGGSQQNAIVYVVNSGYFLIMGSDLQSSATLLYQGSATLQTGGPYSNSSMNAVSVFGTSGVSTSSGANTVVRIGKIDATDPNNTSLGYFYNDAGGSSSSVPTTELPVILTVDAAGRGVLTNAGGRVLLLLTAPNQGYILFMKTPLVNSVDASASIGQFWPQTGGPYNDLTFGGVDWSFGSSGADSSKSVHTDGWANYVTTTFSEVSGETGNTDTVGTAANFNTPYSDLLSVNPVSGILAWYDSTLTTQSKFGIIINPKTFIAVDSVTSTAPTLLFYESQ